LILLKNRSYFITFWVDESLRGLEEDVLYSNCWDLFIVEEEFTGVAEDTLYRSCFLLKSDISAESDSPFDEFFYLFALGSAEEGFNFEFAEELLGNRV